MSRIMHYHGDDTADFYICRDEHAEAEHQAKFYLEFDVGTGTFNTSRIQRFETVDQAQHFCDLLIKKRDLTDIMRQALDAEAEHRNAVKAEGRAEFTKFMGKITGLGVSPTDVPGLIKAFNNLGDYARWMLVSPNCVHDYAAAHPQPEISQDMHMTLGEYMDTFQTDVDVLVVDKDTGEHICPAVCYLPPDEHFRSGEVIYSPSEEWLRSLPMCNVNNDSGTPLAVVKTDLTCDQVNFLLNRREGLDDPEKWSLLFDRAEFAEATFGQRLDYLKNGTPFDVPFDGNCMDAADPRLRAELCRFLAEHETVNIINPIQGPYRFKSMAAYALVQPAENLFGFEFCDVPLYKTEPGKGLFSTIDGKVFYAEHAAKQAQEAAAVKDKAKDIGKEL